MNILDSRMAAHFLREKMEASEVEEFWVLALDPACQVIKSRMLFRGTVDSCFIHPRDIFRFALVYNASSILVGHNHPSGSPYPSRADCHLTEKLREAGKLLQIPVVDHVIIGTDDFYSFAENIWKFDAVNNLLQRNRMQNSLEPKEGVLPTLGDS